MSFIITQTCPELLSQPLGGKAKALAHLNLANFLIPQWLVILPSAFHESLGVNKKNELEIVDEYDKAQDILRSLSLAEGITEDLSNLLRREFPLDARFAVRSSASDEDGVMHSFAGQLESYLGVPPEEVAARVADVWRSGFSERIFAYRRENRLSPIPTAPSVIIQQMINPEVSGVAFSADPVSGRRGTAVVTAIYGLGDLLVSGEVDADTFQVDRKEAIVRRDIARKSRRKILRDGREFIEDVSFEWSIQPALSDEQVKSIARLVRGASRYFQRAQDIEWAIEGGRLYLLQSRPITSLNRVRDPDGAFNLWDNSNIAESYSGVTTPLTFSFACQVYEEVYRQFVRILKVPEDKINDNRDTFSGMLGLIKGRVYYNLLGWYKVLAMLPGFSINRKFMEQMMGVKQALPESIVDEIRRINQTSKTKDFLGLVATIGGLIVNHVLLDRKIRDFYRRLGDVLAAPDPPLECLRADELVAAYHCLEKKLLIRWDAPLINDFFAMIYYGLVRSLAQKWCGDEKGGLQNDLIACQGGIISAEPAQRIRKMAELASGDSELITLLCNGSLVEIRAGLPEFSNLAGEFQSYLEKFGDRCLEELKLESATLHDDPLPLLRSIGHLAGRIRGGHGESVSHNQIALESAERRLNQALGSNPIKNVLFRWVLTRARGRVRDRENLRFERTRVFGRVRRLFVELGNRFYEEGLIEEARDIFYLTVQEVVDFVEGKAVGTNLKGLVALRKAEFEGYRKLDPPADRFETLGVVYVTNPFQSVLKEGENISLSGDLLTGIPCCPGVVKGKARVITEPKNAIIQPGEILVAPRTDPGWIMLFPSAAALVVEYGSLLSHSAIVAREMGIPATVSVTGVISKIKTGDLIQVDGSAGTVIQLKGDEDVN